MPSNKNALVRYKFLDDLLQDKHHCYDIHDLVTICNRKLVDAGYSEVTQRCIEKDINFLEYAPFNATIYRYRNSNKRCIRYENPSFSIFTNEMSNEEVNLLREMLNTIGQFDGLANFEWLDRFKIGLGLKECPMVISFSNNPYLKNRNLLGSLFEVISNHVVIQLNYHVFKYKQEIKSIVFHPYLLKQYNNRWFVIGAADDDKAIIHFALDRIDNFEPIPEASYFDCEVNLEERFESIVGVTLPKGKEENDEDKILLWVSDKEFDYITTKPIHGSQKECGYEEERHLFESYPNLKGGHFIWLSCICNFELKRELFSFFDGLIVLKPVELRKEIINDISAMNEKYFSTRT